MSMAALEPSDAAPPRRVERGGYSEVDVRKALLYLLAHVEQGIAPPTPWFVAHKKLGVPAMYEPLKNAWAAIEKMSADARRAAIAAYELPRKGGAKSSIKIFSDDEEVTQLLLDGCKGRIASMSGSMPV